VAAARGLNGVVASQAWPVGLCVGGASALAFVLGAPWIGALLLVLAAAHFAFFRNPRRVAPPGEEQVVAPADGKIVEIAQVEDPFVGPAVRIAIFLSVFNVHVNRSPISAKVRSTSRTGSRFLAAFNPQASDLNVQSRIDLETPGGTRVGVVQITGLIARRIVSYPEQGDTLLRGEPYGLIHYGSRMEVYLPADALICVQNGARVLSGETVLAEVRI